MYLLAVKNALLLSITAWSLLTSDVKSDYISFEYVGSTDKLMHALYISKSAIPRSEQVLVVEYTDFSENYIVNDPEFRFIEKNINSTSKKVFEEKDYNGFIVSIRENNIRRSYFITRKNSDQLFQKINSYLSGDKKNGDLILRLTVLRTSNVF